MCNPNSSIANRRFRLVSKGLPSSTGTPPSTSSSSSASSTATAATVLRKNLGVISGQYGGSMTQKLMGGVSHHRDHYHHHHQNELIDFNGTSNSENTSTTYNLHGKGSFQTNNGNHYGFQQTSTTHAPAPAKKQKPKRRRKPQKPGLTAKNQERHFVHHDYHDHANDVEHQDGGDDSSSLDGHGESGHGRRGGVAISFPHKLHTVLDQIEADGYSHICSWQPHGQCFLIHDPKEFAKALLPTYFRQTKLTSFQRQLNLYGYQRITRGKDAGAYYHELFLRGKSFLCKKMQRTKVKGTKFKAASSPDQEPDFYKMEPIPTKPTRPMNTTGLQASLNAPVHMVSDSSDHSEDGSNHDESHNQIHCDTAMANSSLRTYFEPPSYYHQERRYAPTFSSEQQPNPSFSNDQTPLSPPMVNSLAAATFGYQPSSSSVAQLTHQLAAPVASSCHGDGTQGLSSFHQSPVDAAVAAIFPSYSESDDLLDGIVEDLFFTGSTRQPCQKLLDDEMAHFVQSFDPEIPSGLGGACGDNGDAEMTDSELGALLDQMLS